MLVYNDLSAIRIKLQSIFCARALTSHPPCHAPHHRAGGRCRIIDHVLVRQDLHVKV